MAQTTIDDFLSAIGSNPLTTPATPEQPKAAGVSVDALQDVKDEATRTAFTEASAAASELLGVLRRVQTGAASKAEANAALTTYKKKVEILKKQDANIAANIEISSFGKVITPGLGTPTLKSDKKGKTERVETPPVEGNQSNLVPTASDRYSNYTLNSDGSVTGQSGDQNGIRQYAVTINKPSSMRPGSPVVSQVNFYDSPVKARDSFIKTYYGDGQKIEQLKQQLLGSNWITQKQLSDGSWVRGLDDFIADYTRHAVEQVKYGTAKESDSIMDYLATKKPAGGTSVKTYRTYTTRGEAKRMFDDYMINLIGSPGTAEQNNEYFNILHKEENKAVSTVVGGTQTGSNLTDADRVMLAAGVAKKALKGTKIESILNSKTGSQVATDIAELQSTASAYGIPLDAATALTYVAEGIGTKDYLTKQKERLRLNAMQLYPTFKDHIAAGGTVKDIADVYAYARQKKLGVVIPNSTQDKKVMAAALSGKSIADYDREMQGEEEWGKTEEARNMGADFTQTILRAFGFGG